MICVAKWCTKVATSCLCTYCLEHCNRYCHGVCACGESRGADFLSESATRWQRLGLNYPDVEHGGRTSIVDFADALEAIDARLEKYEPAHKGTWKTKTVQEHVNHAAAHIMAVNSVASRQVRADLTAAALRALMALQLELQQGSSAEQVPAVAGAAGPRHVGRGRRRRGQSSEQ